MSFATAVYFTSLVTCTFGASLILEHHGHVLGISTKPLSLLGGSSPPPAPAPANAPLPRRYDILDMGWENMFRGWADVQGQGAANDYCRFVGNDQNIHLACALAGTAGDSEFNYISQTPGFDRGYEGTWYMKDEDNDGRDDYCRCVGLGDTERVMCTKAGPNGFFGSDAQPGDTFTFCAPGNIKYCSNRKVRPEFGRVYTWG